MNDMYKNQDYSQILDSYHSFTKKERSIQIIGGLFALFSSFIELIVFSLVKRLANFHIPIGVLVYLILIFAILFIINILTIFQLIIIFSWNRNVGKVERHSQSLAVTNYKMINHISLLNKTIIVILFFNLLFFWFFRKYQVPQPSAEHLLAFYKFYMALRSMTWLLIFCYTIFEIWQLNKWTKRKRSIEQIEKKMLEELPQLQELANLTDIYNDYDGDDGSFDNNSTKDSIFNGKDDENQTYFQ